MVAYISYHPYIYTRDAIELHHNDIATRDFIAYGIYNPWYGYYGINHIYSSTLAGEAHHIATKI